MTKRVSYRSSFLHSDLDRANQACQRQVQTVRFLDEQLAKANERVAELEREVLGVKNFLKRYRYRIKGGEPIQKQIDDVLQGENGYLETVVNKFAIEQQIKGAEEYTAYCQYSPTDSNRRSWAEQLRKEQE